MLRGEQLEGQANSSLSWQTLMIERLTGRLMAHRPWENENTQKYGLLVLGIKAELESWIPHHLFEANDSETKTAPTNWMLKCFWGSIQISAVCIWPQKLEIDKLHMIDLLFQKCTDIVYIQQLKMNCYDRTKEYCGVFIQWVRLARHKDFLICNNVFALAFKCMLDILSSKALYSLWT